MGFKKGLILELASIAGLVLGIYGSINFSNSIGVYLSDFVDASPNLISMLSFVITFILIVVAVYLLAKVLDKTLKLAAMGMVIRITGALFGMVKYALVLTVLLYLFERVNNKWEFVDKATYQHSLGYKGFQTVNEPVLNWLNQLDIEKGMETIEENTQGP